MVFCFQIFDRNTGQSPDHADDAVGGFRFVREKRSANQKDNMPCHRDGRYIIFYGRGFLGRDRFFVFVKKEHHDRNGEQGADFHGEENTGATMKPEEVHEIHACGAG